MLRFQFNLFLLAAFFAMVYRYPVLVLHTFEFHHHRRNRHRYRRRRRRPPPPPPHHHHRVWCYVV